MKAAVLHTLGEMPRCEEFPDPVAQEGEARIRVRAAALKNIDRMRASGAHYDSHSDLPVVCGVDGVGALDDGTRVYFGAARHPYGTMAEWSVAPRAWCFPLTDDLDDLTAAALPNAALSSWLPLAWRARLQPGETVLILGATGVSGKLAIQIARHLGAGRVVAAGRNAAVLATLPALGADEVIGLDQPDGELVTAFSRAAGNGGFDVVLDYLWGRPTEALLAAITGHDVTAEATRTRLVQIGEMAGPMIALPAAALRSSGIELYGSGGGSVPRAAIGEALGQVMALAAAGTLRIDTEAVPLAAVTDAWQRRDGQGRRLVLVP